MSAGRDRALLQEAAIAGQAEAGTMAIIKGTKSCPHGQLSVDFLTQCTRGSVGVVFR